MFDEIFSSPSLQRVLTDVQLEPIGVNQSHWTKKCFKIDSGACGNLMPLSMCKSLYSRVQSITSVNSTVRLLGYNKKEIKQLGTCVVNVRFRSIVKCLSFYVVPDTQTYHWSEQCLGIRVKLIPLSHLYRLAK